MTRDQAEALRWYRRAAEGGDVDAMANLIPLMNSKDPSEVAEGKKWLALAAAAGQPYAVNVLMNGSVPDIAASLAELAKMSLEQIAARQRSTGDELSFEVENVDASPTQLATFVGDWVERVRVRWPDARASTEISGDDVDFPGPDGETIASGAADSEDTLEVTLHAGVRHLQLDLARYDSLTINLTSFEPHPTADEQAWLLGELRAAASAAGFEL